jgi:mannosyltransferase OCH1-like enzyme
MRDRVVSDASSSAQKIPNVYHFVFGLQPQDKPFHLLHYLCLASCRAVNNPYRIVVHLRNEPWGELWDLIRPQIEIERLPDSDLDLDLAYDDAFTKSFSYAHVSDFIRLRVLHEQGGIYADMDTLFIAPPPEELFAESCVMGHERVDRTAPSAPEGCCATRSSWPSRARPSSTSGESACPVLSTEAGAIIQPSSPIG